jgi:hypothetical protein
MIRLIKRRLAIRSYVFKLSQALPRRFGKKNFYSIEQVTKTASGANLQMAFIAYAHAIFSNGITNNLACAAPTTIYGPQSVDVISGAFAISTLRGSLPRLDARTMGTITKAGLAMPGLNYNRFAIFRCGPAVGISNSSESTFQPCFS